MNWEKWSIWVKKAFLNNNQNKNIFDNVSIKFLHSKHANIKVKTGESMQNICNEYNKYLVFLTLYIKVKVVELFHKYSDFYIILDICNNWKIQNS